MDNETTNWFGMYSKIAEDAPLGGYQVYLTYDNKEVVVTAVINKTNPVEAEQYFNNTYKVKYPDAIFIGPVNIYVGSVLKRTGWPTMYKFVLPSKYNLNKP